MRKRGALLLRLVLWAVLIAVAYVAVRDVKHFGRYFIPSFPTNAAALQQIAAGKKTERDIASMFEQHNVNQPKGGWTQKELETALGQPLKNVKVFAHTDPPDSPDAVDIRTFAEMFDVTSGRHFTFSFVNGRWQNWSASPLAAAYPALPPDPITQYWLPIRRSVILTLGGLCLLLFLASLYLRRSRHAIAISHASLLAAFLLTACAEADPQYAWLSPANRYVWLGLALMTITWIRLALAIDAATRRRRKLIAAKICLTCGYDMHVTPDQCPECGTPAPAA